MARNAARKDVWEDLDEVKINQRQTLGIFKNYAQRCDQVFSKTKDKNEVHPLAATTMIVGAGIVVGFSAPIIASAVAVYFGLQILNKNEEKKQLKAIKAESNVSPQEFENFLVDHHNPKGLFQHKQEILQREARKTRDDHIHRGFMMVGAHIGLCVGLGPIGWAASMPALVSAFSDFYKAASYNKTVKEMSMSKDDFGDDSDSMFVSYRNPEAYGQSHVTKEFKDNLHMTSLEKEELLRSYQNEAKRREKTYTEKNKSDIQVQDTEKPSIPIDGLTKERSSAGKEESRRIENDAVSTTGGNIEYSYSYTPSKPKAPGV